MVFKDRSLLVTIYNLDIKGVAGAPLEANTPPLVDPDAVFTLAVLFTVLFKPVARAGQVT